VTRTGLRRGGQSRCACRSGLGRLTDRVTKPRTISPNASTEQGQLGHAPALARDCLLRSVQVPTASDGIARPISIVAYFPTPRAAPPRFFSWFSSLSDAPSAVVVRERPPPFLACAVALTDRPGFQDTWDARCHSRCPAAKVAVEAGRRPPRRTPGIHRNRLDAALDRRQSDPYKVHIVMFKGLNV
jgi:hypothetical protein